MIIKLCYLLKRQLLTSGFHRNSKNLNAIAQVDHRIYSRGSNSEHVWISNGLLGSVFEWRSDFEWWAIFFCLGRFI